MLNIRRVLAAIVLLCAAALNAQVVKQSSVISDVEAAKWATLRTVFTAKLAASKTFMNKLGAGMTRYASPCALIVGASVCGGMRFYGYNLSFWRWSRHIKEKGLGCISLCIQQIVASGIA